MAFDTLTKVTVEFHSGNIEDSWFPTPEAAQPWISWFINEYYKSHIVNLWINGVEFEEPTA